jgi:hypothetical protein
MLFVFCFVLFADLCSVYWCVIALVCCQSLCVVVGGGFVMGW